MWSNTPVDVSASDTEPTSVGQQDRHSAAELQEALVFLTSQVEASQKMSDVQGGPTAASAPSVPAAGESALTLVVPPGNPG